MRLQERLRGGVVIPAHPLAVTADGDIDLQAQRALTRYYLESGADGLAVGVHTTQFELHADPGALREVWDLAAATTLELAPDTMLIAGLVGDTEQAVAEAQAAVAAGYHAVLLSPWGLSDGGERALLERARAVGEVLPTIGFYLQDSVGGGPLGRDYWSALFDLESVIAVKTAPFDRYRTNDVVRALLDHDRWAEVALLTGNDDAIVHDLITPYRRGDREVRAAGGLLGQWAVGTRAAVGLVRRARAAVAADAVGSDLLTEATDLVEVNAAVFDVDHDFAGCVAGVNEVLRQQGLLTSARCLDPGEALSPGQADLIGRARAQFPELLDEEFVAGRRDEWLR
ncbi:dihydrodipicolinate synthase family protein [Occultella aeris]|uniref:Dihydrodipicolinate synthetase family protein n=1 Tax=Occultella aeris TaxID=2761496 RepID=A0A7M4DR27_9MICO|nr:dihydrodipicolinate synthase family protein [Occultella aeris]VZO39921.1 Dihydrodipicolinate synthetase family protein [Occultella aeris]